MKMDLDSDERVGWDGKGECQVVSCSGRSKIQNIYLSHDLQVSLFSNTPSNSRGYACACML